MSPEWNLGLNLELNLGLILELILELNLDSCFHEWKIECWSEA